MKKRILIIMTITYTALMLTGCKNRIEEEVTLREKGIVEIEQGNYADAISDFNQALNLSIGRVSELEIDIDYYKAAAQFKAGLYDEAINTYSALIKYDDKNFKAYYLRGCVYAATQEITKACEDYNKAIECDKKNYELYVEIYENLMSLDYEGEANTYINKLLNVEDKSANAMYYKGRANYTLGQKQEAEELLKKAVDKDITEAKLYLARICHENGDTEQAQKLLDEYSTSDGINSIVMATLGDIEMSKNNYETALDYYNAGLSLDIVENASELIRGKVAALEQLHKFDEAREVLTQYVDNFPDDEAAKNELIFLKTR